VAGFLVILTAVVNAITVVSLAAAAVMGTLFTALSIAVYVIAGCALVYTGTKIVLEIRERPMRKDIRRDLNIARAQQALSKCSKQPLPQRSTLHVRAERVSEVR
jgi:hypothetical protein